MKNFKNWLAFAVARRLPDRLIYWSLIWATARTAHRLPEVAMTDITPLQIGNTMAESFDV